ncbi:MAG TPA: recombinase family protein [Rhizomicrobium sp.]|jgi:site-specific DNA recombinase|nr:recombinase family protein [Rhizomicrobium sp.]
MSKRAAIYARVSTTRQAENDISIPDQLAQARKFCESRGWYVLREFVDPGASARDDKQPQFQAMMDAASGDPSPFDIVLVHSQSRFFRDTVGFIGNKRKLKKYGIALVSMTQDFGGNPNAEIIENLFAVMDEYQSAETAKHVTRSMLENARQGFWNGSKPPFGYRTVTVEQRGQRTKKRLEIETQEAETVRLIFRLFRDGDGRRGPMGVKDITSWLNVRGMKHRAAPFYTSAVHSILTRESYGGTHYFNRTDSRTGNDRPRGEWIAVPVPAIIPESEFRASQERLHARRPTVTPPRTTGSDVLLTGIVRCESCGAPMMLRTGKSGRYRYYACAGHRLKGASACAAPIAIRECELDGLVVSALADHLLTPARLPQLLREAQKHQNAMASGNIERRSTMRNRLKELDTQANRLLTALAEGTVADTSLFRAKLTSIEGEREQCIQLLSRLDAEAPRFRQALSNRQALALAERLKRGLLDAPKSMQRRYVHGLVSEIRVDSERATISGPRAAIAAAATSGELNGTVPIFVRDWRTGPDSNPRTRLGRCSWGLSSICPTQGDRERNY